MFSSGGAPMVAGESKLLSKTQVLLSALVFYAALTAMIGLYGAGLVDNEQSEGSVLIPHSSFNIIAGINGLGWLTPLLFAPLGLIIVWVVASSLPTLNGGA